MALICYHASHEQFAPSHLLQLIQQAEQAGFDGIHSSDHFHPWSERQGQSGFSFAWIGAAMQATHLPFSMVCAPGQRYHPAIVAQAIGTLAEMFPGRFSIELGSGEAINESITGDEWPQKNERNARLQECADIIRRLLSGETVSHKGYTTIREAKLYTRPSSMPLLLCAALSKETAQWCAPWADGLLTTAEKTIDDTNNKLNVFRGRAVKASLYIYNMRSAMHLMNRKQSMVLLTSGDRTWCLPVNSPMFTQQKSLMIFPDPFQKMMSEMPSPFTPI